MTGPRTIMPKKHIIIKTYQKYSKIIKTYQNNHKHIQTIPNPSKSQTIPKQSQKFPKHPKPSKHIQTIPNISKPFQIHQNPMFQDQRLVPGKLGRCCSACCWVWNPATVRTFVIPQQFANGSLMKN